MEWHECYGCKFTVPGAKEGSAIQGLIELDDGYLCAGSANCNSGDLEGSGWHYGTLNNVPNSTQTDDIWLWRVDNDRNIVWSKCYGGSGMDYFQKMFRTEDGGYIIFGNTYSMDGDVASASNINLNEMNNGVIWVFRIDVNGNLLWERCLGSAGGAGSTGVIDVIRHNDREYTLAGDVICPPGGSSGDVNCSNCAQLYNPGLPHHSWDYWLLHITDTVNYDTLSVPEKQLLQDKIVEVYPNPANNTVCVVLSMEAETTEVELVNMNGQVLARKTFNESSSFIEMDGLPQGMYMLKIQNSKACIMRKIIKE